MLLHAWNQYYMIVNAVSSLFLGLGLTVTEINIEKVQKQDLKNIKDVGMARQKVCKQGRDDIIVKVKPYPYIFFTLQLQTNVKMMQG